jgi:hypothetical protein
VAFGGTGLAFAGVTLAAGAPTPLPDEQLKELGIRLAEGS